MAVLVLSKFGNLATPSLQGEFCFAGSVAEPFGALLTMPKFGNLTAPSLEGESVLVCSFNEPVIAFRMMICVTAATLSAALGGFAHGFCLFLGLDHAGYALCCIFDTFSFWVFGLSLRIGSTQRKDKGAVKNQVAPFSDGSLPQVCFVDFGNKMLVSTYCLVIVRIFEILVVSPCSVSFEDQAAAAISRLITLVGLLLLLSDDQVPNVLEFCAAAAFFWITIPVKFGFLLAAAGVFLVRVSICSIGHFSSLQVGISGSSFVFEEGWFLIVAEAVAACLESYLAAAAMVGFISLVKELAVFVIGATRSMGTTTLSKGSSCAATAAASPRVDVEKTPHAAAAAASTGVLTFAGHVWTEFRGLPGPGHNFQRVEEEGRSGGGKLEKLDSFFVFVVSLEGSSVQVRVEGSDSYESLAAKIAAKVNIPSCHWYLTFSGKDLRHVPLPVSMLHRDSTLRMCSRLLGGAPLQPTPGEWFCPACNRGGCWASRRTCFRCLAPRPAGDSTPLQPQSRGRNQRERRALGREPLRSPNQCPTERRPPVQPSGANAQDARASTPSGNRRQPQPSLNVASVLELLKGLNLPDDILDVVSNKLTPAPPEPKPEKLLLDMRLKIDSLTKEADRLEGVVRTKTTELHTACQRSADKARELAAAQQEYNDLKERIDRPMEETQEPTPPPAPSVSNPADVPVDLDEQGFDMDLNNPGIEEEENEDEAGPAVKRKRLSHFDQMMAGLSHFDNESLVTFLGHVQAHAEQQNAIAQEVAVVSCG